MKKQKKNYLIRRASLLLSKKQHQALHIQNTNIDAMRFPTARPALTIDQSVGSHACAFYCRACVFSQFFVAHRSNMRSSRMCPKKNLRVGVDLIQIRSHCSVSLYIRHD